MKAIIIENEWEIPVEIRAFLKDNEGLFSEVSEHFGCLHRKLADLGRFIAQADAVIVMSTWMYRDQLEEFVGAFASGVFGEKHKFFIHGFEINLNKWNKRNERGGYKDSFLFRDMDSFMDRLKKLVTEREVYSFRENYGIDGERISDGLNKLFASDRGRYSYERVLYNVENDIFHLESETIEEAKKSIW